MLAAPTWLQKPYFSKQNNFDKKLRIKEATENKFSSDPGADMFSYLWNYMIL